MAYIISISIDSMFISLFKGFPPAVFNMNGSERQPAPIADDTKVKTAAPVEP